MNLMEYSGRRIKHNTKTINVFFICIGRNIPAGKLTMNVFYLYLTENSDRKINTKQQNNNKCVPIYKYTVFVLDEIFRPESGI